MVDPMPLPFFVGTGLLMVAGIVLVIAAFWRSARRSALEFARREQNLCVACEYDLRGLPPDGVCCPECGTWNLSAQAYARGRGYDMHLRMQPARPRRKKSLPAPRPPR